MLGYTPSLSLAEIEQGLAPFWKFVSTDPIRNPITIYACIMCAARGVFDARCNAWMSFPIDAEIGLGTGGDPVEGEEEEEEEEENVFYRPLSEHRVRGLGTAVNPTLPSWGSWGPL